MTSTFETNFISIYEKCSLTVSDIKFEPESQQYEACRFMVNGHKVISRTAKITPKKIGQFVTFWKRNLEGITCPFDSNDEFDFYVILVQKNDLLGQFIIPKSVLIKKNIVADGINDGKRGFRIYPPWNTPTNKQAVTTQNWQLDYFVSIKEKTGRRVKILFENK